MLVRGGHHVRKTKSSSENKNRNRKPTKILNDSNWWAETGIFNSRTNPPIAINNKTNGNDANRLSSKQINQATKNVMSSSCGTRASARPKQ